MPSVVDDPFSPVLRRLHVNVDGERTSSDQKYLQTAKWRGLQVNVDGGLALGDQKHMQTAAGAMALER